MKSVFVLILICTIGWVNAQEGIKEITKEESASLLAKTFGIEDRAGGTHNASNIGLFFENRGKLYPRRLTQGPSGEFPINSGKHYIYRINPMVGIPGNVIQGRYTENEEWEAVKGYHNSELVKIAFSDNPATWNAEQGWPVKNENGDPVFKSDQDSYCVYDDANNTVKVLGVEVHQTGYAYGVKFAQNIIFYTYEIVNNGPEDLNDLYFNLYCDIDVGNISGGVPEYDDDFIGFMKEENFLYFYDDGISTEWPGGTTGYFGIAMLGTPDVNGQQLGITDMHYNVYYDDRDVDSLQYGIFSSNPNYVPAEFFNDYFHPGSNPDLHYDDPATIPASGLDILANIASGPYTLPRGERLVFYTALVAGDALDDLLASLEVAQKTLQFDFDIAKPPTTPTLSAMPGDGRVTLFWNDAAEYSRDNFTGELDFEGYRIYRSVDKGVSWDQIDRNVNPQVGPDPVPLAEFDLVNNIGLDRGIQYSYTDNTVINGFEYWYSITAYDRGDENVESLESPIGKNVDAVNTVAVTPRFQALGRSPVSSGDVAHVGDGQSNYVLNVSPIDDDQLTDRNYNVTFTYSQRTEKGRLKTRVSPVIADSSQTKPYRFGVAFTSNNRFDMINLTTDEVIKENNAYLSGASYTVPGMKIRITDPDPNAPPEDLPKAGDFLSLNFAVQVVRNNADTVVTPQPILFGKDHATPDGVIFSLSPPDIIQQVERFAGSDEMALSFSVVSAPEVVNSGYFISIEGRGFETEEKGFVALLVKTESDSTVFSADTLYNSDTFAFAGVEGKISFPPNNPPGPGNVFVLETLIPVEPSLLDAYQFAIRGSRTVTEQVAAGLSNIKVVPNPYLVSSLYEQEFGELRREPIRQIQFINLPEECTIYIFTVAGDRVKDLYHNSSGGSLFWDLRSEGGREIATGVYLYVVRAANGAEFLGRFAVIK